MIARRRFPVDLRAIVPATRALGVVLTLAVGLALALALLGPTGTAIAEPRLDRMLAAEQSLTRKIERAQKRLNRNQSKLDRTSRDLERRCAGQSIDRERRARCADLSDSLEQNRDRLDRDAEKLARNQERLVRLGEKITRLQKRTARQRDKLSKRLARAEARVSKAEQQIVAMQAFIEKHEGSEATTRREKVEGYRARLAKSQRMHQRWAAKRDEYRAALEALGTG